jgi:hypothetical protein
LARRLMCWKKHFPHYLGTNFTFWLASQGRTGTYIFCANCQETNRIPAGFISLTTVWTQPLTFVFNLYPLPGFMTSFMAAIIDQTHNGAAA